MELVASALQLGQRDSIRYAAADARYCGANCADQARRWFGIVGQSMDSNMCCQTKGYSIAHANYQAIHLVGLGVYDIE
jgi:hypothetical protein